MAAIARRQRGRVARRQLLAAGITDAVIDGMVRRGLLYRLHTGVYAVGHLAPVQWGAETAALLACNDTAVLSHRSAAALWGLRPDPPDHAPVEVTVRAGGARSRRGIRAHETRTLRQADIRTHNGLPVTSPARTLLDIAAALTTRELERAVDEALATRSMTLNQMAELLVRGKRRPGAPALAALLNQRTTSTQTRSSLEERFLDLIRRAGLPRPEVNVRLHGFEADFLWREAGLVVEVDGFQWHTTKSAFERDHRKDAALRSHGLEVIRFSARQVLDGPYAVVADLAGRLQRAA